MDGLETWDIIKIAAGSGVLAGVVNFGASWFKEGRQRAQQRRLEAEIDAIHLISKLDALAVQCANNYWEFQDLWASVRGDKEEGKIGCAKPELKIASEALSKIDRGLACRIAWLENDVRLGDDGIRARWKEYLDLEDALAADANLVGYFGYEALLISRELRNKYKLRSERIQWGMPQIEEQLSRCSSQTKKFFDDDN
ncbi:hypothetical protein [Pseudomonas sp. RIT357]|uniref:hypothetical protein n=1 Tax=Pseudomonas sp. RIT357 TaxID=1470593 RepID=UPI0004481AE0|nr:hypothetical protein [Pseudomonas sp. RIT357]EZP62688.1 hypothetical protein BW43_05143 [Pseudomonas sp. RIT357]